MNYWNTRLREMTEYIPGEQPQDIDEYIKLNTNENSFPPSKQVLEAIKEAANDKVKLYPDPKSTRLRELFAEQNSLNADNIFVGNGSDEIFTLLFRGFIEHNGTAAFTYPSYSLYYTMSEAYGINFDKINAEKDFSIDLQKFSGKNYNLVIISNPNNPTGTGFDINDIRKFLKTYKGLLVVDEAYVDFYGETAIALVKEFDNIIITRSFSKSYSLAGLRIGLAVSNPEIINGFFKLKDSYNVNRISEAGAIAALKDIKNFKYNIQMLINNKEYLEEQLYELGFEIVPSKANFLFVKHSAIQAENIYNKLKNRKILVRYFQGPVQSEYLRITVGTMMEIKKLIQELASITEA
ncbi:MAG: histidinol-phosphate transaminase [Spirochaetes bacterium]|nr:histidinol-phosphate transaminase [Spirochaetota bacterium]